MPTPASPIKPETASTVLCLFRQLHEQIRNEISDLDDAGVNWVPTPGANSIATIVTHIVGSEAETIQCVAGVPCDRDRGAEFLLGDRPRHDIVDNLAEADHLITDMTPRIDRGRLHAEFSLPTLPDSERRSGLTWLIGNYGHAREHVGQIQLTKQLYLADAPTAWAEGLDEAQDPRV